MSILTKFLSDETNCISNKYNKARNKVFNFFVYFDLQMCVWYNSLSAKLNCMFNIYDFHTFEYVIVICIVIYLPLRMIYGTTNHRISRTGVFPNQIYHINFIQGFPINYPCQNELLYRGRSRGRLQNMK